MLFSKCGKSGTGTIVATLVVVLSILHPSLTTAEKGKPYATVSKLDSNGDGKVDLEEWPKSEIIFNKIDKDGDGFLSPLDFATHRGILLPFRTA